MGPREARAPTIIAAPSPVGERRLASILWIPYGLSFHPDENRFLKKMENKVKHIKYIRVNDAIEQHDGFKIKYRYSGILVGYFSFQFA